MPARKIQNKKPPAKKQKVAPVVKTEYDLKLEKLIGALSNEAYPIEGGAANREMLIKGAPCIFCEYLEDRHDNQKVLGGFIDEAMAGIRKHLEDEIAKIKYGMDNADALKAELITKGEGLTAALAERDAAILTATEARDAKKTLLGERTEAQKLALGNAKACKAELAAAEKELAKFTRGQELFLGLVNNGRDNKSLKEVKPLLLALEQTDPKLVEALDAPSIPERGIFAGLIIENATKAFADKLLACTARITEIQTANTPLLEAITAADTGVEEAKTLLEQAKEALEAAKTAQREAKSALLANEAALMNHDNDVLSSEETMMHANVALEKFSLIEADLTWLKVRSAPVPVPEIIEDDEVKPAEELPAADVAMEEAPVAETTAETEAAPAPIEEPLMEEAPLEQPMMA